MAQLSVYLDDQTRKGIERAAKRAGISVSQWVKEKLVRALSSEWPPGYLELLGSLEEEDLDRSEPSRSAEDAARERL